MNIVWGREEGKRQFGLRVEEKDELEVDVEKANADSNFSFASQTIMDNFKAHMKVRRKKDQEEKAPESNRKKQERSTTVKTDIQRGY